MKSLHRSDLFGWSEFDTSRNVDFNSVFWVREQGNVVVDPMPISNHDRAHVNDLGGCAWVVVTNSDHARISRDFADATGARVAAPSAEQDSFPIEVDRWLHDGDEVVPGLTALALNGSKTPGELALVLEGSTLITGDLVRAHRAGALMILPDAKLSDREQAVASVRRLAELDGIEAVLVGDGWPVFRDGSALLRKLASSL